MVITPFCPPSGTSQRFLVVSTTIIISRLSPVSSQTYKALQAAMYTGLD